MIRNKLFILYLVTLLMIVYSCKHEDVLAYKDSSVSLYDRVSDLLSRMTLEEKFWQLFMIPGDLFEGKEKYKHGIFGFQVATKSSSGKGSEQMLDYSKGGTAKATAILINDMQKFFF